MRLRHVAAFLLLLLVVWSARWALPTGELRDYGSFIASGRAGAQGLNPYGIYPLTFHVVLPEFEVWNPNLNPPITVLLFAQLARLQPQTGFLMWFVVSLACYVSALWLLAFEYRPRTGLMIVWPLALAGLWDTLALGQIYLPLVLAATAAWILLDRGYAVAAGVLMGIVIAVKPNFAPWPALLLLAGHWRASAVVFVSAAAISAIPLLTHGAEIYRQWIALVLSDRGRVEFLTNASLTGLASRMGVASVGLALSAVLLLVSAVWAWRARPDIRRASALGILCGILASPIAWVHYTLFLLPAFFGRSLSGPLLAAATLMIFPVPILLGFLDAPLWQQLTIGSAYNWAMLFALAGFAVAARGECDTGCEATELHRTGVAEMTRGEQTPDTIVFYDGFCGLCDRFVHFLLMHDRAQRLRFATLQGALAERELVPAGHDPADLETVLVIADFGGREQRVLARSRAVLHALSQLGGFWAALAAIGRLVPRFIADALYSSIGRRRYRMFGRYETCPLPRPEWRDRFLDQPDKSISR